MAKKIPFGIFTVTQYTRYANAWDRMPVAPDDNMKAAIDVAHRASVLNAQAMARHKLIKENEQMIARAVTLYENFLKTKN